ncbi:MAG: hypothetical protein JSV62_05975, partial [Promethearchaeota archaeon]
NYRDSLSVVETMIESDENLREELYHKIIYCKELINSYELINVPELLETEDWPDNEHENLKTALKDIKKIHSYVKSF